MVAFQYLEWRFNRHVRILGVSYFILYMVCQIKIRIIP